MSSPVAATPAGRKHQIVTPEGVPLDFELAGVGDRLAAFFLDFALQAAVVVVIATLATLAFSGMGHGLDGALGAFVYLLIFLVRNFYFVWFELNWKGRTPGKKLVGTQVIDRHGGMLTAEAVFARNLTRELEFFLPLVMVLQPQWMPAGEGTAPVLFSSLWLVAIGILPLVNRDRLRAGDLIGGTLVVRRPEGRLGKDLAAREAAQTAEDGLTFTPAQLDLYGVYELQVLEDLLRRRPRDDDALDLVAHKIQEKIRWRGGDVPPREFLRAFYDAQRLRLEHELLLGQAREKKRSGRLGAAD